MDRRTGLLNATSILSKSLPGGARIASNEIPHDWSTAATMTRPQQSRGLLGHAESSVRSCPVPCPGYTCLSESETNRSAGFTGLSNLGNTCFMNCILQALGNITELRDYFLSNNFLSDINKGNSLGTGGQLARAFYTTLRNLWSGQLKTYVPEKLKTIIARRAPQFVGFMQHDAQEFMAFFLDTLHEDLNRTRWKPELEIQLDGHLDSFAAERSWSLHKSRNDSFIVDHFHGMYKSKLTCPSCKKESVTFDPFLFLPVPLPKSTKIVTVTVFRKFGATEPSQINVPVSEKGTGGDILEYVSKMSLLTSSYLRLFQTKSGNIAREIFSHNLLPPLVSSLSLILCEIMPVTEDDSCAVVVLQMEMADTASSICAHCGKTSGPDVRIRRCTKCKQSGYCGQECQRLNWPSHKLKCCQPYLGCPFMLSIRPGTNYNELMQCLYKCAVFSVNVSGNYGEFPRIGNQYPFNISICYDGNTKSHVRVEDQCAWPADFTGITHFILEWLPGAIDSEVKLPTQTGKLYNPTIQDCIQLFTEPEVLATEEAWYCPQCRKHRQAIKEMSLWRLPDVLIIQLKRFLFRNPIWRDKIDRLVEFPVSGLDLSEFCIGKPDELPLYDLFGVVNHHGGSFGGHYTSFVCLSSDAGPDSGLSWKLCDDNDVTAIHSSEDVVAASSYVLFYHRRNKVTFESNSSNKSLDAMEYKNDLMPCSACDAKSEETPHPGRSHVHNAITDHNMDTERQLDTGIVRMQELPEIGCRVTDNERLDSIPVLQSENTKALPYTDMDAVD